MATEFAYVATETSPYTVYEVALPAFTLTGRSVNTSGSANSILADSSGAFLYVSANGLIVKIDLSNFTVVGSPLAVTTDWMAIDAASAYLYAYGSGTLTKISLSSFSQVNSLSIASASQTFAIDPSGTYGYVPNTGISKIDLGTMTQVGSTLALSTTSPNFVIVDNANTNIYVTDSNYDAIYQIAVSSFTQTKSLTVAASDEPFQMAIDPSNSHLYFVGASNGIVGKIAIPALASVSTISVGAYPAQIAIDHAGAYAYVASPDTTGSGELYQVNLSTFSVVTSILSGTRPTAVTTHNFASAPSSPTLSLPANASYQDVSSGITLGPATYNSTDGANQNAYALRIKVSGGSYNYWNASTNALQSTIVWNAITTAVGGTWSVTLPPGILSNGNVYNWSFASQEASANLQGVFASDFTFTASAPPTTTVTAPTGNIASNTPVVTWTDTFSGSGTQADYQVKVETGTYGTTPGSGTAVWDSGVVASAALLAPVGVTLTNTVTYRAFVQVTNNGGQVSVWGYTTFTITVDAPATPTLTAVATNDPTTGAPMVQLTLQANDNELTTVQASLEGGLTTGWTAGANTTIASSATWSQDGSYSLAMTATAAGAVIASTPIGTSGVSVVAGSIVRAMAFFHSATTARACTVALSFYNAAGTLLSTVTSTSVNSTLTGSGTGAQAFVTATAPVGAVTASLTLNGAALGAGEVLYADSMLIAPGNSTTWTRGGLVGTTTATINFSDDQVNYYPVRNATAVVIPSPSQTFVVNDYEGALGFTRYYQGQVSA